MGIVRIEVLYIAANEAASKDLGAGPPIPAHEKKAWRGRVSGI
jgi:hypothetical protein